MAARSEDYDVFFKVVLLGNAGVGKSCLMMRYVEDEFDASSKFTIGVDFRHKFLKQGETRVKVQIWDTSGQERFRSIVSSYYRGAQGVILVFDLTNVDSFEGVAKWMRECKQHCKADAQFLLVGNKCDLPGRTVSPETAQEFANDNMMTYIETSAKASVNVDEAFETLVFGQATGVSKTTRSVAKNTVTGGTKDLPLVSTHAVCEVRDIVASVVISHLYRNTTNEALELVVAFPIEECGTVCKFEGENSNGDRVYGKVMEKKAAADKYDDAIAEGKIAVLLEEREGNIFQAHVGLLQPGATMTIRVTYITELQLHRGTDMKFIYKTLIHPEESTNTPSARANLQTVVPEASIRVKLFTSSTITSLKCNSHIFRTCSINGREASVSVDNGIFDANFELFCVLEQPLQPRTWMEYDERTLSTAVMVSILPPIPPPATNFEFIFIVDRSGSMSGAFWNCAANALQIFMRSLPEGCHFQVVGFGTTFETVFSGSVAYNDDSLSLACRAVATWTANLGGTEILEPLMFVFNCEIPADLQRRIVVLTDGFVTNTNAVIECVRKHKNPQTKVYCMGIGTEVDVNLVTKMSEVGGGVAEFSKGSEALEVKVLRQLKRTRGLDIPFVRVDWGDFPYTKLQDSYLDDGLFIGGKISIFALLEDKILPDDTQYRIRIAVTVSEGQEYRYEVFLDSSSIKSGTLIHACAAKHFIKAKLNAKYSKGIKDDIVQLCTKYSISSIYASFIAVEESVTAGQSVQSTPKLIEMTTPVAAAPVPVIATALSASAAVEVPSTPRGGGKTQGLLSAALATSSSTNVEFKSTPNLRGKAVDLTLEQSIAAERSKSAGCCDSGPPPRSPSTPRDRIVKTRERENSLDIRKSPVPVLDKGRSMSFPNSSSTPVAPFAPGAGAGAGANASLKAGTTASPQASPPPSPRVSPRSLSFTPSKVYQDEAKILPEVANSTLTLTNLIVLQRANGFWRLSSTLAKILASNQVELDPRIFFGLMLRDDLTPADESLACDCWATALALAVLETKFLAEKEKWELLAEKAYVFLEKNVPALLAHDAQDEEQEPLDFDVWIVEAKKWLLGKRV